MSIGRNCVSLERLLSIYISFTHFLSFLVIFGIRVISFVYLFFNRSRIRYQDRVRGEDQSRAEQNENEGKRKGASERLDRHHSESGFSWGYGLGSPLLFLKI